MPMPPDAATISIFASLVFAADIRFRRWLSAAADAADGYFDHDASMSSRRDMPLMPDTATPVPPAAAACGAEAAAAA